MKVAVLIPCYNEEASIGQVVTQFKHTLPEADIYVYDNNSTDDTVSCALNAGAVVRYEPMQGKGNVVRRMFADVEADVYVMVDGDGTYEARTAPCMINELVDKHLDMVVGCRVTEGQDAYRFGHQFGNMAFNRLYQFMFGKTFNDIFSGYRVFSRRFVKSFPALTTGFEIETELSTHASELKLPVAEIDTPYYDRIEGGQSKLSTYRDGLIILLTMALMFKEIKPLFFYFIWGGLGVFASVSLGVPVAIEFLQTGLVLRLPTAVLATGIMLLAFMSFGLGFLLDSVSRGRRELKRLHYLACK